MVLWDSVSRGHNLKAGGGHILLWALYLEQVKWQVPGWKVGNRVDRNWRCRCAGGPGVICGTVKTSVVAMPGLLKERRLGRETRGTFIWTSTHQHFV